MTKKATSNAAEYIEFLKACNWAPLTMTKTKELNGKPTTLAVFVRNDINPYKPVRAERRDILMFGLEEGCNFNPNKANYIEDFVIGGMVQGRTFSPAAQEHLTAANEAIKNNDFAQAAQEMHTACLGQSGYDKIQKDNDMLYTALDLEGERFGLLGNKSVKSSKTEKTSAKSHRDMGLCA